MKKFEKGCAVDVRGMSEVMFDAIKRVGEGVDNGKSAQFEGIGKHQEHITFSAKIDSWDYEFTRAPSIYDLLTPTDILGPELVKAIEEGCTPWFEGDKRPVINGGYEVITGDGNPYKSDWSNVIAYKLIEPSIDATILSAKVGAADILKSSLGHMEDRAKTYDNAQGERSMGKTVSMFNILYKKDLTEEQGWAMMCLLKMVRSSQGEFKLDNYEDLAAYSGLMGEGAQNDESK